MVKEDLVKKTRHFRNKIHKLTNVSSFTATDATITSPATGGTAAVSVPESLSVGDTVFTVLATDADNDGLLYTIKAVSASGVFALGLNTGVLTLSTALDFETTQSYTVEF